MGYTPLEGAINRSVETIIGILVSLGVNNLHLPRKRTEDYLFVTGFDGALYDEKNGISPYASFELNQLLQDGLPFTIATERTPASLMADLKGLDLRLPVIAMDGAVLYDVKDKRYRGDKRIAEGMGGQNLHPCEGEGVSLFPERDLAKCASDLFWRI